MTTTQTEFATIEREIHIDASPEVVFAVVSRPEHIQEWWAASVTLDEVMPGARGELGFGDSSDPRSIVEPFTVVEAEPPHRFAFRWIAEGEEPAEGNSLLVTFELSADGAGTTLKMSETGFREKGWEAAVIEQAYNDHCQGWDANLPRIAPVAMGLEATA